MSVEVMTAGESVEKQTGVGVYIANAISQLCLIEGTFDSIELQIGGAVPTVACDDPDKCVSDMGLAGAAMDIQSRVTKILERSQEIRDRLAF